MATGEEIYYQLQRHLDRQTVGFPATKSGAEIRILKHIFTPREGHLPGEKEERSQASTNQGRSL